MAVVNKQMEMSQQQQNVQEQHVQQSQEQQQSQNQQVAQGQMQQQQMQTSQSNQQQQQSQSSGQHNVQQVQVQPQVAASMPQQVHIAPKPSSSPGAQRQITKNQLQGAVAVSMQHQGQQQGVSAVSMALSGQQGATTITTMAAHPQAVQVIQQPMQSQAYHLQQLYNTQGTPLLMPGNLALHPASINPSSIQVITGKPFQSAAQLTPHMLTTTSNPGQAGGHAGPGGKVQGFPAGYLPVPTSANPGGGQTLVFGQLGVLGSPQPPQGLQQQQAQQNSNKPDQVQKYTTCATGTPTAGRGGAMQFAPWQFTPQVAWTGLQPPGTTLLAAPNQIFIRSPTQPDMYIQSPQPIQAHNALATQQQIQGVQQIAAATTGKPRVMDIQQQPQQQGKQGGTGQRPLSILPSLQGVQNSPIRPPSSVSTQTVHGTQTTVQMTQSGKGSGSGGKGRGKPVVRTSPGTNSAQIATKDAANQTKSNAHHATMIMQQQTNTTTNNGNNKVLITTNQPVVTSAQPPGSPMTTSDKQNFGQQNKTVMQSPQQHQSQQQPGGQPMQPQYQQMFMQQMQHIQHQQLQYQQAQAQNSQQQIQPKPIMGMALPPQQQPGVVLGTERPIMPVVSMGGVGVGVATTLQMNQVQQSQMPAVQPLPIPTLNPTIIGNQVVSGGSQVQTMPMIPQPSEAQPPPPQQQDASGTTPMVIASPERSQQNDCPVMVQQCNSGNTTTEEENKSTQKKEDGESKETPAASANTQDSDSSKSTAKEETATVKIEEKLSNPLANLAIAVNSITNGVADEPPVTAATPVSINSKQAPPKALVKPQVLTHVIEGFVIQEAAEPFPVRSTLNGTVTQETNNNTSKSNTSDKEGHDEPPRKKHATNYSTDGDSNGTAGKCEACGNILDEHNIKFKKDKRFCSSICAKNKKREVREREADKQWTDMDVDKKTDDSGKKSEDRSPTVSTPTLEDLPKINPVKWTVNEVCDFIRNLPGCADYAEDFAIQEIDGQALMLLKEDHLMSAMSIKLGPALKIVAKIDSMRVDNVSSSPSSNSS